MDENLEDRTISTTERPTMQLDQDIQILRVEIVALRKYLAKTTQTLDELRVTPLIEANEYLVLAARRANKLAISAKSDLVELTRASERDALTNTVNRTVMLDRIKHAIAVAQRHTSRMAVLFLDLDKFKYINDELGHAIGDEVLMHATRCMSSVLRDTDTLSRHGGDEFLVLLEGVAQASDTSCVAEKILKALALPNRIDGRTFRLSASLGIAIYPEDGSDAKTLIAHADAAMYQSKKKGPGGFAFHASDHCNT